MTGEVQIQTPNLLQVLPHALHPDVSVNKPLNLKLVKKKKKKDLWGLMDRNNPHSLTTPSHHDVFFNDLTMVMRAFGGVDWVLNQSLLLSRRVTLNISNFPMYT